MGLVPPRGKKANGTEPLGFEDVLWKAADKLRGSMDASEYKHVVLGLIFLKYVEDAFEERRGVLREELAADGLTGERQKNCWSRVMSTRPRACSGYRRKPDGVTCASARSNRRSAS